ncbi:TetR/AcrR family transcriptional regulator [Corynebacterium sp. 13CS0277]|uniref:TetR/AcrR family transcriptional regulator n=1 Tax=Corynebacterium sp. 13CS0277 TaxID=2071994 RepID=UPI001304C92D|nr:TetR/AcrR family transcriptional regulator [Corynebacterium sp. 13CS0277]
MSKQQSPSRTTTRTPSTRGRRVGGDYTRDDVIAHAIELFIRNGYEATSVGAIAASMNVTKAALYHHVSSKEELLITAIDAALALLDQVIADCEEHGTSAEHKLRLLARGTTMALCEQPTNVTLLLRLRGNTPAEQAAMDKRRAYTDYTENILRACAEDGILNPGIDPAVGARLLFGCINSLVEWYSPTGPKSPEDMANMVEDMFFHGMITESA